jgi:hypothetical protein
MKKEIEIPDWCKDDAINSYKYGITYEQKTRVREWYTTHLVDKCEVITDYTSGWIGRNFGTKYWSASSQAWNGYRLYVGQNTYVHLEN